MPSGDQLQPGLYLIATPIGNMGDITRRAVETLAGVDRLYAEDTRHSRKLLAHLGIERGLMSCHEHNEADVAAEVVRLIESGQSCGLISDAGTPGISDPGFRLTRACRKVGLPVTSVPGPSSVIAALCASGLPTDRFEYLGFLPPKRAARLRQFEDLKSAAATLVFLESTHRIGKFLEDAESVFGPDRVVCLARELTKLHETVITGPLHAARDQFAAGSSKGEFVVMVAKEGYVM